MPRWSLVLFLLAIPVLRAQTGAGSVQGTVRDTSGSVIPAAEVALLQVQTNQTRTSTSNNSGYFTFPNVFPGAYKLIVKSDGMQTWEGNLQTQAGLASVIDPILRIGDTATQITVAGDVSAPINLENGTVSRTLERQRIEQLPLNGRSLTTLISQTTPGLEGLRAFGLQNHAIDVVQDGAVISDRDNGGVAPVTAGLDSVQEFQVEMNSSSAKMNRPATAIVTTRSGSNQWHGSLFWTARNNGIGVARRRQDFYDKPPQLIRNEFGMSFGGPVSIPKLYNGRDRTFFFVNYEGFRQRAGGTASTTVPTMAMRQGDFSGLIDGQGRRITIYDPWSTGTNWSRTPFPGNQLPSGRLSPTARAAYAITPVPTMPEVNPILARNFFGPGVNNSDRDPLTFRVDHNFSGKDRVFVRGTRVNRTQQGLGTDATFPTLNNETNTTFSPVQNRSAAISWTRSLSPTFFSETLGTWSYQIWDVAGGTRGDWANQLGLPNPMGGSLYPIMVNTGFYQYRQPDNERTNRTWIYGVDQNFTKVAGKHQLSFGFRYRNDRTYQLPDGSRSGFHDFSGPQTGLYDPSTGSAYGAFPQTGHAAANFYLGLATSYSNGFVQGTYRFNETEYSGYFQDDWRLNSRLTLNLGLRYQFHPALGERDKAVSGFDLNSMQVITGAPVESFIEDGRTLRSIVNAFQQIGVRFTDAQTMGLPAGLIRNDPRNIAPRVGFAYKLTNDSKTVVRGGFGIYVYPPTIRALYANLRQSIPFSGGGSFSWFANNAATSPDGLPNLGLRSVPTVVAGVNTRELINFDRAAGANRGGFTTYGVDPDQPTTRVAQWNLTVERTMPWNFVGRVGYVGNHGYNLEQWSLFNQNPNQYIWFTTTGQPLPTGEFANVLRRPSGNRTHGDIQMYRKSGFSNSNAINLEMERRHKNGYSFQLFYVLTNAMRAGGWGWRDDPLPDVNMFLPNAVPTDAAERNRFLNYERDIAIPKHRLRWNWLVDFPIGKGKPLFGNSGGLLNSLIGGWQVAGFGTIRSNYWALPTNNWGSLGNVEIYGTRYPIEDCRSGRCIQGYLYHNGYIPANRINSVDAQGRPNGVMGVPANYRPASLPVWPTPARPQPGDPNAQFYDSNTVFITLANGAVQRTAIDTNLHPWRQQYKPGPNLFSMDASLFKATKLNEKVTLRFNADFFNVLNMPGLNQPDPTTGILTLQNSALEARQLQLTMRLIW